MSFFETCFESACCKNYFAEWRPKSIPKIIAAIYLVLYGLLSVIFFIISIAQPTFFGEHTELQSVFVFSFALSIIIMIVIYAPFQSQLFPTWYIILSFSWYAVWSIFVLIYLRVTTPDSYTDGLLSIIHIYTDINCAYTVSKIQYLDSGLHFNRLGLGMASSLVLVNVWHNLDVPIG